MWTVRELLSTGGPWELIFFWGHTPREDGRPGYECFSQWWPARFAVNGVVYPTAEHFMMAEKAHLFGDEEAQQAILAAEHPQQAKSLGRLVRGFEQRAWEESCRDIVVRGNLGKFSAHRDLREVLLGTGDRVLVEASPLDRIWGIGLAASDPRAGDPELWEGKNLLGFALMECRRLLRKAAITG